METSLHTRTAPSLQASRLTGSTTGVTRPKVAHLAWPRLITTTERTPASPCAGWASPPSECSLTWVSERASANSQLLTACCLHQAYNNATRLFRQGLQSADVSAEVGQQGEVGRATGWKDQCVSSSVVLTNELHSRPLVCLNPSTPIDGQAKIYYV